jgi:hypothetical protein
MAAGDPVRLGQSNVSDINTSIQTNQNSVELLGGRAAFQAFCNPTNQNQRTRGVMGRTFSVFNAPPGASARSAGVFGTAESSDGNASGVHGTSAANNGVGVLGQAVATTPTDPNQQQNCAGVKGTSDSAKGVGVQAENAGGGFALKAGSPTQTTFTVETDFAKFTDRETAIWLVARLDGVLSLRRVRVREKNTGGTGFRMLVIPNDPP